MYKKEWFDDFIYYGTYVPLSVRRWTWLSKQVTKFAPDLPFYVCVLTSADVNSKMVRIFSFFS